MTETPTEINETELEDVTAAGLLLPAVQSAGRTYATPPKKHKVWPWHFW